MGTIVRQLGGWALLCWTAQAAAQSLDGTLERLVEEQVERQVEEQVAAALEREVADQVAADVAAAVAHQVQSNVAAAVERQVVAEVAATVAQQVEADVVDSVRSQVESGVTEAIRRQGESGAGDVLGQLRDAPGRSSAADGEGERTEGGGAADQAAQERFAAAVDGLGRLIERDVWVILVPAEHAGRIEGWGFTIRERRELAALGRVLLRVAAPEDRDIAQAALDLTLDAPGTSVDFNHVYRPSADLAETAGAAGRPRDRSDMPASPALAVGSIDSAIAADHEALHGADIVQRDFVPFDAARPLAHGTAVAAILVGQTHRLAGRMPRDARLYAASVFFTDDAGNAGATTASLVAALEWLAAAPVPVVNMSLAGPPNRVLEQAIDATTGAGALVIAAVGNNGPFGEPQYPAAYPQAVGVTAVDDQLRVYRYANRGPQVMFAAPGVHVEVARSGGGYGRETGTSIAAPYAAAVIARALAAKPERSAAEVLASLQAEAKDLGDPHFDEVFGFGLIAMP